MEGGADGRFAFAASPPIPGICCCPYALGCRGSSARASPAAKVAKAPADKSKATTATRSFCLRSSLRTRVLYDHLRNPIKAS